jgi:hypothetical protein
MRETYPLVWPVGIPRTRPQDREERRAWKKTERQFLELLEKELKIFKAFGIMVTRKDPSERISAPDPSAAVYFSRRSEKDFRWQDALGITSPDPSLDQVNQAFRELAKRYHPDLHREDAERMVELNAHRDAATRYIKQLHGEQSQYCIPCDKFEEFKWNIAAIRNTVRSFRQMERDGTSRMVECALQGFAAAIPEHAGAGGTNVVTSAAR